MKQRDNVERGEEQHVRNIISAGLTQSPSQDGTSIRHFLATVLLRHYLGTVWCDEYAKPGQIDISRSSRAGRQFLRTDGKDSEDRFRHQVRLERLTELLYNLQDVPGIAGRRATILEGMVESTYAELEFAGHFIRHGVQVRFLDRSGVRGNDYDFDAWEEATTICCEVKCKLESTDLGENTIINTLNHAREQVPRDQAAIIGVKLPELWIRQPTVQNIFLSALASFFRNSGRVIAVIARWEEVLVLPLGEGMILYKFNTFSNEHSRYFTEETRNIVQQLTQSADSNWTSFRQIVSTITK